MIIGKVIGNVWATRKADELSGLKLMVVRAVKYSGEELDTEIVAADCVGAGTGDLVIVTKGSSARKASYVSNAPIDAMIVGIIDEVSTEE